MIFRDKAAFRRRGMSLIELTIVIGVLGIIFAAVFLFFTKGMEQFHFSRRQNELATAGRLALEQISEEIIWAGYLVSSEIPADEWHPIQATDPSSFTFYADFDRSRQLEDSDWRHIFLGIDNNVLITDNASMSRRVGFNIKSIQFEYLNSTGAQFSQPLTVEDMEAVRHIRVTLVLEDSFMGNVYQTSMRTTVSPRNLGLNRNIDPAFLPPPSLSGIVVLNVDGTADEYAPTPNQYNMMQTLTYLGLTVVILADEELAAYDYEENNIDLVILRDITTGDGWHSGMTEPLRDIPCAVICLDADDAMTIYEIGLGASTTSGYISALKVNQFHNIHLDVPQDGVSPADSTHFQVYNAPQSMNFLTDIDVNAEIITSIEGYGSVPGVVCVKDEDLPTRRVLYGLPIIEDYTEDGHQFFRNVLYWSLGGYTSQEPGEPITMAEDFEGEAGQSRHIILWEDNINSPEVGLDSIAILNDDFSGLDALNWTLTPLGDGEVVIVDEMLRMHRPVFGNETRNVASVTLPLAAYDINNDDLYLRVMTSKGAGELIGANDGICFTTVTGGPQVILSENFSGTPACTFWNSGTGRYRVHEIAGWLGDGRFVTMDSNANNSLAPVRMMFAIATGGIPSNTEFTVNYRFHDHNDANHSYNASTGTGDFMGWNSHGGISGSINLIANLTPGSFNNSVWHDRTQTFTVTGVPPNPLYLVFGQYDNTRASSLTGNRGISFDNIQVVYQTPYDTTYTRFGTPSSSPDWNPIIVDLNQAALNSGIASFTDDFKVVLSQSGTGPWNQNGICWDDFEVGRIDVTYSVPGWLHKPFGGIDDWSVRQNPVNPNDYMWSLHANPPANVYSNFSRCRLQTPSFLVPEQATNPTLSFRHYFDMEAVSPNDYGYLEVSVSGGPWTHVSPERWLSTGYTHTSGGLGVFSGTSGGWRTETLDLTPWKGESVTFRFVFISNGSVVREGWYLDDFVAECMLVGHELTSVAFRTPTSPDYTFQNVDVYIGSTDLSAFSGGGMWDPSEFYLAYSGPVVFSSLQEWQTIPLASSFFIPDGENLMVRIETENLPLGPSGSFSVADRANVCRAAWGVTPPTWLPVQSVRPAARFVIEGETVGIDEDATQSSSDIPMSFISEFSTFEAIYTAEELGLGSGITWTSGGINNDWEIGAPLFFPDVDPTLLAENGEKVAGDALTTNMGYHSPSAWAWLASSGFPMEEASAYDTVVVRFMRCLRLPMSSNGMVQIAFGNDPEAIPSEGSWITVREYNGAYHQYWQYETVNLTSQFNDYSSYQYYFLRFLLDSGPYGQAGGWNLDNIQFFGRTVGK